MVVVWRQVVMILPSAQTSSRSFGLNSGRPMFIAVTSLHRPAIRLRGYSTSLLEPSLAVGTLTHCWMRRLYGTISTRILIAIESRKILSADISTRWLSQQRTTTRARVTSSFKERRATPCGTEAGGSRWQRKSPPTTFVRRQRFLWSFRQYDSKRRGERRFSAMVVCAFNSHSVQSSAWARRECLRLGPAAKVSNIRKKPRMTKNPPWLRSWESFLT